MFVNSPMGLAIFVNASRLSLIAGDRNRLGVDTYDWHVYVFMLGKFDPSLFPILKATSCV